MKRALLALSLFVVAPSLVACGGSVCQRTADALENAGKKAEACVPEGEEAPGTTGFNVEACEERVAAGDCTEQDQKTLDTMAKCLNEMGTCTTATQEQWGNGAAACILPVLTLSESCQAAFSTTEG